MKDDFKMIGVSLKEEDIATLNLKLKAWGFDSLSAFTHSIIERVSGYGC